MADRGILFSTPMVRALLDGRKTQTRRLVKPQPSLNEAGRWRWPGDECEDAVRHMRRFGRMVQTTAEGLVEALTDNPARRLGYAPGDRLWVRETWKPIPEKRPGGYFVPGSHFFGRDTYYRADGDTPLWADGPWRPSLFMPRKLSRLTLVVTEVRVQRLQEISDADAWAEGVKARGMSRFEGEAIGLYADLWDSLHGASAWDANPWVAAISFTVHRANIDQLVAA